MAQQQHYIPRILTKAWEHSNRTLWYFDCESLEIKKESSTRLLSEQDLWEEKYEKIFQKAEKRMSKDIQSLIQKNSSLNLEESSDVINNLLMLHFFNAKRSMKLHWNSDDIDAFYNMSSSDRDKEIEEFAAKHKFLHLPLSSKFRYYYPQSGFFRIPIFNNITNEMDIGVAIPIHPQCVFAIVSEGFNSIHLDSMLKSSETMLVDLSLGAARDKKIIIHPDVVSCFDQSELIERISKKRVYNIEYFTSMIASYPSLLQRIKPRVK